MGASENCNVKVAVHVRPLIPEERVRGRKECIRVTPGKPQVQIGTHSFTFDHVYGNGGSPSSAMFEECIAPLVDGLFQGYNATVLAYGQTGSGKTYTMGMGVKDSSQTTLIPQVMNTLFDKIETLKHETEFQLHVSFIEILKEEVRDLLDSASLSKSTSRNCVAKDAVLGRPPIQIRESSKGIISLAGSTEIDVSSLHEMAACLEQGSLSRATGSTNMNNHSSRSHAIFTITLEQMRKLNPVSPIDDSPEEDTGEEYSCAKLHLVDLAGSERPKRTGSDGLRLREGIHINKGLLALGNVISALGDEKKLKESVHVPYRDSKLTRLLQDSLGGNSKTVMIACISPADINAEETLNTLKYANRARNIQNKPVVNRDLISSEIQVMQQQLKRLQAELYTRGGGSPSDEMQVLKDRIAWLEATNEDLSQELLRYRSQCTIGQQYQIDAQETYANNARDDGLKRDFRTMDSSHYQMDEAMSTESSGEIDEATKEWEHAHVQSTMDKQLNELNRCWVQKESEMTLFGGDNAEALGQQFRKKIMELDDEKRVVQEERDCLLVEIESLAANYDGLTQKTADILAQKLKALEPLSQMLDLKRNQESQVELAKQKPKSNEAARRLQAEIQYVKAEKLRKEGRRNEYEQHKLEALHHHQKMVHQIKTAEAATATKILKELLEACKSSTRENSVNLSGHTLPGQGNERSLQLWFDHELEIMVNVHRVRVQLEKQRREQAALAEELALLKHVDQISPDSDSPAMGKNRQSRLSPDARKARITSLENMLNISSITITAMALQLTEAEARELSLIGCRHGNQLCSMEEAGNLLQYMFTAAAEARCQLWEKDMEIKSMKDQLNGLMTLLRQSEVQRKELVLEQKTREQVVYIALAKSDLGNSHSSSNCYVSTVTSGPLSPMSLLAPNQLKLSPGIVTGSIKEPVACLDKTQEIVPIGQLPMKKLIAVGQTGKLWSWRSHYRQGLLQFKWKWQKPWKLSEWIKHGDETIMSSRHRLQALVDKM